MPAAGATRRSIDWKPSFDRFIEWRQCGKRQCVVGCEHSCCSRSRRRRRRRIEREREGGGGSRLRFFSLAFGWSSSRLSNHRPKNKKRPPSIVVDRCKRHEGHPLPVKSGSSVPCLLLSVAFRWPTDRPLLHFTAGDDERTSRPAAESVTQATTEQAAKNKDQTQHGGGGPTLRLYPTRWRPIGASPAHGSGFG